MVSVQFSSVAQLCPALCDPMTSSSEYWLFEGEDLDMLLIAISQVPIIVGTQCIFIGRMNG